jgi:hypothetical protein
MRKVACPAIVAVLLAVSGVAWAQTSGSSNPSSGMTGGTTGPGATPGVGAPTQQQWLENNTNNLKAPPTANQTPTGTIPPPATTPSTRPGRRR